VQNQEAQLLLELGTTKKGTTTTVGELVDIHLMRTKLAPSSLDDYRAVRRKMPEWMTEWCVSDVDASMIDSGYARLLADGWSAHRLIKLHSMLNPAFRRAIRWDWLATNPCAEAEMPDLPDTTIEPPTIDEVLAFLAEADHLDPAFGVALRVSAATSLRRGEVCGLQWGDLELDLEDGGAVTIRRSVVTLAKQPQIISLGTDGKKKPRRIALDAGTVAMLKAHRLTQGEALLARGQRSPWVFTHDGVNPWRADYMTQTFASVRDSLKLEHHVRLHDLRHFAITQMLGAGVDLKTVMERAGHTRIQTTLNRYAAFLPERDRAAANMLGELLTSRG
jgi:integrase